MNREIEIIKLKCRRILNDPQYQIDIQTFDKEYQFLENTMNVKSRILIFLVLYKKQASFFMHRHGINLPLMIQELRKFFVNKEYKLLKELFSIDLNNVQLIDRPLTEKERMSAYPFAGGLHTGWITLKINPLGNKKVILKKVEGYLKEHSKRNPPLKDLSYLSRCLNTLEKYNLKKQKNKRFSFKELAELMYSSPQKALVSSKLESYVTQVKREILAAREFISYGNHMK